MLNPDLIGKPVGIQQKNLLVTCSYEARAMGVEKCMNILKAIEKCPSIIIINGEDLYKYRDMSQKIYSILQEFSPTVEKLGLDENYIDVSALVDNGEKQGNLVGHVYGEINMENCICGCQARMIKASAIAQNMRDRLKEELGITCTAG
jgi:DNA polymerase iota